jgi:hypothetical protein
VIALVMEAIQNTLPAVIAAPSGKARRAERTLVTGAVTPRRHRHDARDVPRSVAASKPRRAPFAVA